MLRSKSLIFFCVFQFCWLYWLVKPGQAATCFVRADLTPAASVQKWIKICSISTVKAIFTPLARHFEVELAESLHIPFPLDCERTTSITRSLRVNSCAVAVTGGLTASLETRQSWMVANVMQLARGVKLIVKVVQWHSAVTV